LSKQFANYELINGVRAMPSWNRLFTSVIRNTNPVLWGNWSLDSNVKPGAIGKLLSDSGAFQHIGNLRNFEIKKDTSTVKWQFASNNISRTENKANFDGSATDPETQTKITAGVKVSWVFNESEGITSEFAIDRTESLDRLTDLIESEKGWLIQQAKIAGMGDGIGLSQGFGFISSVVYAKSGLNVGSSTRGNSFSLSGSASAVNELVGAKAQGKGSYISTSSSSTVDLHIWPAQEQELADSLVPIAFTFVSFDGEMPIIDWTQPVSSLILSLKNNHGGTYIVDYTLKYDYLGKTVSKSGSVSGALTQTIGDIPLRANNLELVLEFRGVFSSDRYEIKQLDSYIKWSSPICNVDLYGVWPGETSYQINFLR
jgi:hypothetical protein